MGKKIISWFINSFLILLLIVALTTLLMSIQTKGTITPVLGFQMLVVKTGSMEPTIKPGDVVFIKTEDTLQKGDVITYKNSQNTFVTHRIVDIEEKNGEQLFQTKGDANNVVDEELVSQSQLVGTMKFHLPKIGLLLNFIKSPTGIFLLTFIVIITISFSFIKKLLVPRAKESDL